MDKQQLIDFIKAHPLFFLATCEGEQARVRGMMMYRFDEHGLIFTTGRNKEMYRQLKANPAVELCFYHDKAQVRVTGKLEEYDDLEIKKEIVEARPFMKPWIEAAGYDVIAVFRMSECVAISWSMENPLGRKRPVKIS
jgi:pyridoxamine 5'-phosphate oxidase